MGERVCMQKEPKAAQKGSGLPCSSTSGLYIRPLINPEWRPGSDRLTGQAPVQDRAWFITTELRPALIYFSLRKGESPMGVFKGTGGVDTGNKAGQVEFKNEWESSATHQQDTTEDRGCGFVMINSFEGRFCAWWELYYFVLLVSMWGQSRRESVKEGMMNVMELVGEIMNAENFSPSAGLCSFPSLRCQSEWLLLPYLPTSGDRKSSSAHLT